MVESGSSVLDVHKYGGKLNPLEASQSGATPDDRGTTHLRCAPYSTHTHTHTHTHTLYLKGHQTPDLAVKYACHCFWDALCSPQVLNRGAGSRMKEATCLAPIRALSIVSQLCFASKQCAGTMMSQCPRVMQTVAQGCNSIQLALGMRFRIDQKGYFYALTPVVAHAELSPETFQSKLPNATRKAHPVTFQSKLPNATGKAHPVACSACHALHAPSNHRAHMRPT
eukprot:1155831-Pelagomonas_calceolata.AAC.1